MSNIHLRGLDEPLAYQLKQVATHQKMSVNTLILNILRQNFGLTQHRRTVVYHDLDKFASTWTSQEAKLFMDDIADFEQVDETLWK